MPRVSIWLPDDLHHLVKELDIPVSELAQRAISTEVAHRHKRADLDAYIAELEAELGPAGKAQEAKADAWAERVTGSRPRQRSSRRTA